MHDGAGFQPLQRVDVFREVLSRIEQHVATRTAGDRLPSERQLAAELNVSRPVVRQALKVLEGLGRLKMVQGSGTYVQDVTQWAIRRELLDGLSVGPDLMVDLLPLRRATEAEVLRSAFERHDDGGADVLAAALEEQARHREGEAEVRMDLRFEAALGAVCGNELLRRFQSVIHGIWLEIQLAVGPSEEQRSKVHREHVDILAAYRAGDVERGLAVLDSHLSEVAKIIRTSIDTSVDGPAART